MSVRIWKWERAPMDLSPDDEQDAVTELARTLGSEVLAPAARVAERSGAVPPSVWATLLESGLTLAVPEELGGGGVPGPLSRQIAVRHLAHGDPGIALAAAWSGEVAGLLAEHGDEAQRVVPGTLVPAADRRGSVALYEGFGRGLRELETTVAVEGDVVRVVGTKLAVPFAAVADPMLVIGRDPGSGRLRAAVLTGSADGVTVEASHRGLALHAAQLATVSFDVALPPSALLGGPAADPVALEAAVQRLRLYVGSALLGTALRATTYAAEYAKERTAFGRPIAHFQGVSFPLAESLMAIEASRLEIADLVTSLGRITADDADRAVGSALAYAGSVAVQACRHGVQCLGGHGFVEDHPVELWYRSATAMAALDLDPVHTPFAAAL